MLRDPLKPVRRLPGPIDYDDPNIKEIRNTGTKDEPEYEIILHDPTKPVMRFQGEIDWSDPNIYSPHPDTGPDPIDAQIFNELVMQAAEHAAITWTTELKLVDGGDTVEQIEKRKKTPFRIPRPKKGAEDEEETEEN
jgi:hypothetical protein